MPQTISVLRCRSLYASTLQPGARQTPSMQNVDEPILSLISPTHAIHTLPSPHQVAAPIMTFSARPIPFSSAFTAKIRDHDWNFFREMDFSSPDLVGTWDVVDICPVQTIDPRWLMTFDDIQRLEADEEVKTGKWGTEGSKSDGETESDEEAEAEATLTARSVRPSTGTTVSAGSGKMKSPQDSNTGRPRAVSSPSVRTTSDDNHSPPDTQHFSQLETPSRDAVFTARHPPQRSYPIWSKGGPAENSMPNNSRSQKNFWSPPIQDETPFLPPSFLPRSISTNISSPIPLRKAFVQRDFTRSLPDDEKGRTSAPPSTSSKQYSRKEWMTCTSLNPTALINTVSQSPSISSQSSLVPSLSPSTDIHQSRPPNPQKRDSRFVGIFSPSYTESEVQPAALPPSPDAASTTTVPELVPDCSISSFAPDSRAVISTQSPPPVPDPSVRSRMRVLRASSTRGRKRPHSSDAPPRRSKRLEIDDAAEVKDGLWSYEELGLLERMKSGPRHSTWLEIAEKLNREVGDIKETWRAVLRERQTRDWKVARITHLAAEHDRIKWGVIATVMGIEIDECISLASELELI